MIASIRGMVADYGRRRSTHVMVITKFRNIGKELNADAAGGAGRTEGGAISAPKRAFCPNGWLPGDRA
jgi:hypothetical protein